MSGEKGTLNQDVLAEVCHKPGQTISQVIETIFEQSPKGGFPSKDTIRRRIYRLGALGYLSLRLQVVIYPTEKAKIAIGHVDPQQDSGDSGRSLSGICF